tara:strand:+ start:8208 stop:8531 length:324 start_codon:yes stop_codon:yes gene_type:complete
MKVLNFEEMKGGWFVGDFEPTAYKTKDFEVCYKFHSKGEVWDKHYHKKCTEINLLIKGVMKMRGQILKSGQIFILEPFEVADPEFIEDCYVLCVKTSSEKGDKICIS